MRHYTIEDEVRLALGRDLHDWRAAGLLTPDEEQNLRADVATDLRGAGIMLRLGLAGFTFIAGAGAVGLIVIVTGLRSEVAVAIAASLLGAASFGVASGIVRRFKLYRYGAEEVLALGAVGLWGCSAGLLAAEAFTSHSGDGAWFFAMATVAAGCAAVYRRFGFQYAAVGVVYATALLPMASRVIDGEFKRIFAALVCAGAYRYATAARGRADNDVTRADAETVRSATAAGAYLALNSAMLFEPFGSNVDTWYRWTSWIVTWLLPFLIGRAALAERDPLLLRVALAAGLVSLLTNKAYLGWPRQPWDPMILGVVLISGALVLRRWLSRGEGGERDGFTARQLVYSESTLTTLASVTLQPASTRQLPEEPTFSGGRSGGAGAGSNF